MNFHVVPYRSYEATLAEHYAGVRARLGGLPTVSPTAIPVAPVFLLPPPREPHAVADPVPDQRGKQIVGLIGAESEIIAARRTLMTFARLRREAPSVTSIRHLQVAVATAFKVDVRVILSPSRRVGQVRIRHIAMMLAHCCCKTSREEVSRRFNRNHATVMYAEKKLASFLDGATSQIGAV